MKNKPLATKRQLNDPSRLLDAPLLIFDLPTVMEKMKREETWQHGQRNAVTLLKSDSLRIVLIALRDGAEIDFRQSDNLICLHLLKGKLEFNTDEEKIELEQGYLLTLHENVQHSLIAAGEVVFLLTIGNGPSLPV